MFEYALLLIFPAVMAFGGAMDLLTMTIPNRITLGLTAAFFLIVPFTGLQLEAILPHIAAGALILVAGIALFAVGGFGGGDAKLLATGALWIGFDGLPLYLLLVTMFGGALAVAILAYRYYPMDAFPLPEWAARLHKRKAGIPYGIAIAASALAVYPQTALFSASLG